MELPPSLQPPSTRLSINGSRASGSRCFPVIRAVESGFKNSSTFHSPWKRGAQIFFENHVLGKKFFYGKLGKTGPHSAPQPLVASVPSGRKKPFVALHAFHEYNTFYRNDDVGTSPFSFSNCSFMEPISNFLPYITFPIISLSPDPCIGENSNLNHDFQSC
ncbi:unnamed protein product [Nesidiocoris tenuis]|uniref:Uncharacterized protein n=1 Tax=Nesidiocoris tenuis TaxID=355587 RepID=A0A6H5FZH7_9HEMI|nr:unnamed protein product [Nesidiocoris tenuis]